MRHSGLVTTVLVTVLLLGWSCAVAPAFASFNKVVSATSTAYTSSTLVRPLTASGSCGPSGGTSTASLTWSASSSTYTTGYQITSTPTTTTVNTGAVTSGTVTGLTTGQSYTFSIKSTYRNWSSTTARTTALIAC